MLCVPKKPRTKDDHDDEDDLGRGENPGGNFSFDLLLFLARAQRSGGN